MDPTKSFRNYMAEEMNRLFSRSIENDNFLPQELLNASMAQSSSSTDTSPESISDMFGYQYRSEQQLLSPARPNQSPARPDYKARSDRSLYNPDYTFESFRMQQIHETPSVSRRERPIVGRKIIKESVKHDAISNVWSEETRTPHTSQNVYYELFPSIDKGTQNEMKTGMSASSMSVKPSNVCTNTQNLSPYASSMSQWTDTMSEISGFSTTPPSIYYPRSPSSTSQCSRAPSRFSFKEPFMGASTSSCTTGSTKLCTFCRKNGETPLVYMKHTVKEKIGGKDVVTCPILRSHVCSTCGASGDDAHTISYCPVLRSSNNGKRLQSTTVTLKNTRVKSNGRRRF